ncbi:MAG TPA: helix-turn-helix domain-containing protein, partial [Thermoanaerobaculia bacterium]
LALPTSANAGDSLREALDLTGTLEEATGRATRIIERMKIEDALSRADTRNAAADLLGISTRSLTIRMKELELE